MKTHWKIAVLFSAVLVIFPAICTAGIAPGQPAPIFSEKDSSGKEFRLESLRGKPMVILYFFDVDSRSSREGLANLGELTRRFADVSLSVVGITSSPRKQALDFVQSSKIEFPVLLDSSGIEDLYHAKAILPTVCILGPDLNVLDYIQGGGKTTEIMLVRLAERNLQRQKISVAKAISDQVIKKHPENAQAKAVKGYAALKENDISTAEKAFKDISGKRKEEEIIKKEGLTAVYAKKGETGKALEIIQEVEQKAPDRGFVNVIKGDILYSQKKTSEAEKEYAKAVSKTADDPYHKSLAFNRFGRFKASVGQFDQARSLYDQALEIEPYDIEATSNKGVTYEKENRWDKALESYQKAVKIDAADMFSSVLARKAEQMLAVQRDSKEKERIDRLVKELAERFRSRQSKLRKTDEDPWTSRPMILAFVDFQEEGSLSDRDGFSTVITSKLAELLNTSNRVNVVERVLLERLLEELNLGSSELADPETALRLGKVLAAKLIGTGQLLFLPDGTLLTMRLIDSETSGIAKVLSRQLNPGTGIEKAMNELNRDILKTVIEKYPLRGFVVRTDSTQIMVNIGSKQGVIQGTEFEVLEEQKPIEYKGKVLTPSPKPIAEISIEAVEPDFSIGKVIRQEKPIQTDMKIQEKLFTAPAKTL